jgi:tripartite-type tricarboxylate transporter receptor subunit TctC
MRFLTPAIVEAMNRIVGQIMVMPDVREKLAQDGAEPAQANTPAEFKAIVTQEVERWDRFLKTSGIRLQ